MRTETIVCTDDLDGSKNAETVTFALDGVAYTIDLVAANHSKLTAALAPFISSAKRIGKYGAAPSFKAGIATVDSKRNDPAYVARVKAWAAENGHSVASRGRIPSTVVNAYKDAGGR